MPQRALVLGAGGHAAIAWELGMLVGLAECGIDVRDADLIVGTSGGAVVGAMITGGVTLEQLFNRQIDPDLQTRESAPRVDMVQWRTDLMRAREGAGTPTAFLQRIGAIAIAAATPPESKRRAVMAARLGVDGWPVQKLAVVAVDAESGERRVFDNTAPVHIVDAVAASSAVPGIYPTVTIDGRHYMDGGIYSLENADLAAGFARVLILSLPPRAQSLAVSPLDEAIATLKSGGAAVESIHPDEAALAAFALVGWNVLDPAVREPAARAGRAQAHAAAERVRALWSAGAA
jgi:NTE family protein